MVDNVAVIDYAKCKLCRECEAMCPTGAIHAVNFPKPLDKDAVKEAGVEPVGRPEVTVDSADETNGVTLTVKVAVKPEVKVGSYNGLTVEKTVHTVSDEAVEAELERVQERNARELTREGAAENGDIADIDFEGFVDGVAFEGGKAEHYSLTLGSGAGECTVGLIFYSPLL